MRWTATRLAIPAVVCAVTFGGQTVPTRAHASAGPPIHTPLTIQNVATGTHVDVSGGDMKNGQKILEWNYHNSLNQQWWLGRVGNRYKIKSNVNGAYCLTRQGDGDLQNAVLGGCDSRRSDWDFESLGGDRYRIKDPAGPYYLNVRNSTPSPGRGLVTSAADDHGGAYWFLTGLDVRRRPMPADPRLDQVTFLTAHNAMANTDEGFWGRFPNQSYGLRSQLDQGIRGVQLDAHAYRGDVYLCHNSCAGHERTLTSGLQTVVDFLNADREAVVTAFLEDYTTPEQLRSALSRVNGLSDLLFRPDRAGVRRTGWPRMSELVAGNQRLLIFSQRSGREDFGVMHDRDWTAENHWTMGLTGANMACYSRWSEVPLSREEPGFVRLHVMNHYRDIPTEGTARSDNGPKLRDRVQRYCGPAARRKPSYVAVDFFQKSNGTSTGQLVNELNTYW